MYTWYDVEDGEDSLYGWYDGSDEPAVKGAVTLAPGDALWIFAQSDEYSLQTAGAVAKEDINVVLRQDFKLVCNPTPVNVDLVNITVGGYDKADGCDGEVYIQSLNSLGRTVSGSMFTWYDIEDGEDSLYGWYDGSDEPAEEGGLMYGPGEAIWVYSASDSYSICYPGVEIK